MTRRWQLALLLVLLVAIGALLSWAYPAFRRVDGLNADAWLARARSANRAVMYHAEGETVADGHAARFVLDQHSDGRYAMQTTDTEGHRSMLCFDGHALCLTAGGSTTRTTGDGASDLMPSGGRILGTRVVAGRSAVRVGVRANGVEREVAIDRATGVILAQVARFHGKEVSRMTVADIAYRDVTINIPTQDAARALRPATPEALARVLGSQPLEPRSLPSGLVRIGAYLTPCCCGDREMAAVRYGNGVNTLTLFQMRGATCGNMGQDCRMARGLGAVVASRTVGAITVIAVGDLPPQTVREILDQLG